MIDNQATVAALMSRMQAQLPIPAFPTRQLVRTLRGKGGLKLSTDRLLFIQAVQYAGDEGGITCDVTPTGGAKEVWLVSLTHLRIRPSHPLFHDIRAYQSERVRRIGESQ